MVEWTSSACRLPSITAQTLWQLFSLQLGALLTVQVRRTTQECAAATVPLCSKVLHQREGGAEDTMHLDNQTRIRAEAAQRRLLQPATRRGFLACR